MEDRAPDLVIYEKYYKRLTDTLEISGKHYDGINWWFILIPILAVGAVFIIWMYVKDSKSIRWFYALPLGLMRATVYGLLAYMFLLPTLKETRVWQPITPPSLEKRSRVVVLFDVSDSMANHTDDPSTQPTRKTRLQKVLEMISDENAEFFKKLCENNPVYVYRFASNLDRDEVHSFRAHEVPTADGKTKSEIQPFVIRRDKNRPGVEETVWLARWDQQDWLNFAKYTDFKGWVLRGLSPEAQKEIRSEFTHEAGGFAFAKAYLVANNETILSRVKLSDDDANIFRQNLDDVRARIFQPSAAAAGDDLKTRLLQNLSKEGRKEVIADFPIEPAGLEWAQNYLVEGTAALSRLQLADVDSKLFKGNLESMKRRLDTARTITQGTNVPESVQAALDAEKDNMLQGIVVFSDGRSNLGVDVRTGSGKDDPKLNPALENLHRAAKKADVPIVVIGIGAHRDVKVVRVTDLQTPDQTPPDDAFKIIVEVDGEHMKGETVDVELELFPPDSEVPILLPGKVTFDQGEPPHGQFEWTINPPEIFKKLDENYQKKAASDKEIPEGIWRARASTAKVSEEGKPDPRLKVTSELMPIRVEKKSVRVLLMASSANRDFQFLMTQLIRDKAEVSIYLQNEAGTSLDKSITYLDDKYRHLIKFPDRLELEDKPDVKPEEKWLNLALYDVIIAFDPDWTLLDENQAKNLRTWVDLQAGGLLHVAGSINTKKLTFNDDNEVKRRLEPLMEIFPVLLGDNVLSKPRQERNILRRLEFPGASPEMEFLRLDDDKPEELLSGWEPFFTGKPTREAGVTAELKRGFYDYYPVKGVKDGATIVARYPEPQASENTFDKKDPPYIVTYKYGQGMTAFLGSSEMWRFRQYKDVFFERFWVKMSRYLASGSRKKQNRRGRILMSKEFVTGESIRSTIQLLDSNLKGIPASDRPKFILRPIELDVYPDMLENKKDGAAKTVDNEKIDRQRQEYLKQWTIQLERNEREVKQGSNDGYFPLKRTLKVFERVTEAGDRKIVQLIQAEDDRLKLPAVQNEIKGSAKDFPTGIWRLEAPIPKSSESLSVKFVIRKPLPPELADTKPDMLSLAAIASKVESVESRLLKKTNVYNDLKDRAFYDPKLDGRRLAYAFTDKSSINLIPEAMPSFVLEIDNPQTEPEIRRSKIDPIWFEGPKAPRWMTSWYDNMMGQTEQTHTIAMWMLICISLLSLEWLTRKLLKLA